MAVVDERIQAAIGRIGLSPEHVRAVGEHAAALAEGRGIILRDRVRAAARERAERARARRPGGLAVVGRTLAMAWVGLLLGTLTIAFLSRSTARRTMAALTPDVDDIRIRVAFGPLAFRSRAAAFRGGLVDLWYAGGFVDLREATIAPDGALLKVRAVFGGGQIVVPESWRITSRVRGIGGLRDLRPAAERPLDAPHLVIEGSALFGGFTVQSELPVQEAASLEEAVARMSDTKPAAAPVPVMDEIPVMEPSPVG